MGVSVGGPQGFGKSHTLVSLVETLQQEGHIVTFIPDCEKWKDTDFFVELIASSLGSTAEGLDLGLGESEELKKNNCSKFLEAIANKLTAVNQAREKANKTPIYWILVFDQLNRIFGRQEHLQVKDMGVLPRPYSYMKELIIQDYVTCVVSASADNSLSYKENHKDFRVFDHEISMSEAELKLWKPELSTMPCEDFKELLKATGGAPLQVATYMENPEEYTTEAVQDVLSDVVKLLAETDNKRSIVNNAVNLLLQLTLLMQISGATESIVCDAAVIWLRPFRQF